MIIIHYDNEFLQIFIVNSGGAHRISLAVASCLYNSSIDIGNQGCNFRMPNKSPRRSSLSPASKPGSKI